MDPSHLEHHIGIARFGPQHLRDGEDAEASEKLQLAAVTVESSRALRTTVMQLKDFDEAFSAESRGASGGMGALGAGLTAIGPVGWVGMAAAVLLGLGGDEQLANDVV